MQIVRYRHGRNAEETFEMIERLAEELHSFHVFEIADVLAQDGIAIFGQAQGVFQLAAAGQNLLYGHSEIDRLRSEAAGSSDRILAVFKALDDGIVHSGLNLPIVQQKVIG